MSWHSISKWVEQYRRLEWVSEWARERAGEICRDRCCASVKSCETVIPTASSTASRYDENWVIATALHQNARGTLKQYSTSFEVGKLFLRRGPIVRQIIYTSCYAPVNFWELDRTNFSSRSPGLLRHKRKVYVAACDDKTDGQNIQHAWGYDNWVWRYHLGDLGVCLMREYWRVSSGLNWRKERSLVRTLDPESRCVAVSMRYGHGSKP
jgi:hypothetical protein